MGESYVYLEPKKDSEVRLTIKRSHFIGHARLARSVEQAKEIVREISMKYLDATHNCWAYRVGADVPQRHCSDAGEPSGTAGKPILGEIERAGLTNVVVVVTRYFGGIKLGVRGLIEAYGQTARMAIEAAGAVRRFKSKVLLIELPYDKEGLIRFKFKSLAAEDAAWRVSYGENVRLCGEIPLPNVEEAERLLLSLAGQGIIFTWKWLDD
ncbi:MAG TPA: YigZ family protein [Acetomicrobium flavidum]|uniref:IMPACT family protein n=1 Tax=Acetomicrobium flavidum TaxID=49896 RepID=UPI002C61DEF3|nr:YigZ family protein [Acetomicrobium flavidum]